MSFCESAAWTCPGTVDTSSSRSAPFSQFNLFEESGDRVEMSAREIVQTASLQPRCWAT